MFKVASLKLEKPFFEDNLLTILDNTLIVSIFFFKTLFRFFLKHFFRFYLILIAKIIDFNLKYVILLIHVKIVIFEV
jgi:hypothetical protein